MQVGKRRYGYIFSVRLVKKSIKTYLVLVSNDFLSRPFK